MNTPNGPTPGNEEDDHFDVNYKPLSAQQIRIKNWENYSMHANKTQTKHKKPEHVTTPSVTIPSFSISAMENGQHRKNGSLGGTIHHPLQPKYGSLSPPY